MRAMGLWAAGVLCWVACGREEPDFEDNAGTIVVAPRLTTVPPMPPVPLTLTLTPLPFTPPPVTPARPPTTPPAPVGLTAREYRITFTCTSGCSGAYAHFMTVDSIDSTGEFVGHGRAVLDSSIQWTMNGHLSTQLRFDLVYTGANAGHSASSHGSATPDANGRLTGTTFDTAGQNFTYVLQPEGP